jgi:uncharacterized protein (TIGR00251 family)
VGVRLAGADPLNAVPADPVFLRRSGTGVTVELRAQPRARRSALACSQQGTLKAMVTAPAEDGKANRAVIELLAAEWRLPKSAFEVMRGATARDKTVSISGEPASLAQRIGQWIREQARGDV